ncbi:MAG: efflux RND transporter periplasmic adaptor subunit [Saprospiraceae bacterium]|nr:efflux RND transporter periplasmic adaptor subunit [Saprospiraceae bacterium]
MITLMTACNSKNPESVELEPEQISDDITVSRAQFNSMEMQLGEISMQSFAKTIKATGSIELENSAKATISSHFGGVVQSMSWKVGEYVKKGTLMFTLTSPEAIDLQKEYLESKAQLTYLEAESERQNLLAKQNAVAHKTAMKATSDYKVMSAMYQSRKEKLQLMNISPNEVEKGNFVSQIRIFAPISGYISKINTIKGMYLSATESAMEIVNTDQLHLLLQVFEKDVMQIKKGQEIIFKVPVTGNKEYRAEVFLIGKMIESEKRLVEVHGHLRGEKTNLLPGMYTDAELITETALLPALPDDALVIINEKPYIFILANMDDENYKFQKMAIFTGEKRNSYVEISNSKDIPPKSKILIKGAFDIY